LIKRIITIEITTLALVTRLEARAADAVILIFHTVITVAIE
jgi:hypothetical protein